MKKLFTFLFALAASVGASWATVYNSGMVALSNLNVGDILMEGVTLTSEKADYEITLAANRVKCFSSIQSTDWNVLFSSINPVLGENAVILTSYPAIFYTPIDETGNIGNAWEVTENEVGTEVTIAGITYGSSVPEEPGEATAIDNININAKAVKEFHNGILYILRPDGAIYNATGVRVK